MQSVELFCKTNKTVMHIQAKLLIEQYTNFEIVMFYYLIQHLSNHDVEIKHYCTMKRLHLEIHCVSI